MSTDFNSNSLLHSDADFVDMFPLLSAQEQNKFWKEESENVFQNVCELSSKAIFHLAAVFSFQY